MSVEKILEKEFEKLLSSLDKAKLIYEEPLEYLEMVLAKKYKQPFYSNEDWATLEKEKMQLLNIYSALKDCLNIAIRLKENYYKLKAE